LKLIAFEQVELYLFERHALAARRSRRIAELEGHLKPVVIQSDDTAMCFRQ